MEESVALKFTGGKYAALRALSAATGCLLIEKYLSKYYIRGSDDVDV